MDDLISRKAAIDAINVKNVNNGIISALQSIIEELPSAQPKKGRWINHNGLPLPDFCSVCAKDSPLNKRWNYCPNCGTRMEVGDETN